MKYRGGFVSNSSSSSFLIIVPEFTHRQVYKTLHPYEKAVVDALVWEENVLGIRCVLGGYLVVQDEGPFGYIDIKYEGEDTLDGPGEAWGTYVAKLKNIGPVFINRMDG